ncbi:hypothetical protein HBI23_197690 [Parastagonospora nodorum]|nr:hypothetical protein HBI23_197690 [Parastagonospora nodorum]
MFCCINTPVQYRGLRSVTWHVQKEVFVAIAMWFLPQNGMHTADGGFLQVMMATRGDTEMDRLILREGAVAVDEIPKDLGNLKKRMEFGTVDETLALKN